MKREGWIDSWVRLTTTRGQGEYDSPHYMGLYLLSMSYLAAWANDPAMKKRAAMMLDYLIADYAAENLDGIYVGAHSRVYDQAGAGKVVNASSDFGWLLFGLGRPLDPPDGYVIFYVLASAYEPPEILKHIATDRSAALHALRTQAHPQPLALLSTTCTALSTRPPTCGGSTRSAPTRAACCSPSRSTPGTSRGMSPTRAACKTRSSPCTRILR